MNAATEEYNDLVKCMEHGFMGIDNDIIMDLRKQDETIWHFAGRSGIWKGTIRSY